MAYVIIYLRVQISLTPQQVTHVCECGTDKDASVLSKMYAFGGIGNVLYLSRSYVYSINYYHVVPVEFPSLSRLLISER